MGYHTEWRGAVEGLRKEADRGIMVMVMVMDVYIFWMLGYLCGYECGEEYWIGMLIGYIM